jgi:hypothetical protein
MLQVGENNFGNFCDKYYCEGLNQSTTPRLKPHPSFEEEGGEIRSSQVISTNNYNSALHVYQAESLKCKSTGQTPCVNKTIWKRGLKVRNINFQYRIMNDEYTIKNNKIRKEEKVGGRQAGIEVAACRGR